MERFSLKIITTLCFIWLLSSCDKNTPGPAGASALKITVLETSVPVTMAEVCGMTYDNVLQLTTGTSFILKIRFEGPRDLSQYKIDIHSNFDCHAHQKPVLGEWNYLKIGDLSGTDLTVTEEIPLPEEAYSGNYHCIIRLIDQQGNEASFVELNLVVSNAGDDEAPVISYTLPSSDSIVLYKGDEITFKGTVTDNLSLNGGRLEITYIDAGDNDYTAIYESFPGEEIVEHHFERSYEIPVYIALGTAVFKLKAYDKHNNSSERLIKVHVLE